MPALGAMMTLYGDKMACHDNTKTKALAHVARKNTTVLPFKLPPVMPGTTAATICHSMARKKTMKKQEAKQDINRKVREL